MSSYLLTETAEDELREILGFVAEREGRARALSVLEAFEAAWAQLVATPEIGFRRPEWTGETIRWWPVFRFLVLYEPTTRPLTILRIVHSARDLERLLRR